ncbi:outer membrane protein transport protein [uncultured Alistipes sp.]|jgi:long-chain fatty acid transport protein|uniref:OmpP1/FadL family transporter n=1 Tax=uncultured Alistipes sp. TaxID=538949 RepID=UPI0025CC9A2F|nr:outer membrane protein transport protein [uncultured Alistipes sp.]
MKKIFLLLAAAAISSGAYAEGYQVNNLSSKQNGMGHVGTAMKLNSESLWFNPAAASFQSTKFDFSIGITGIDAKATYTTLPDYTGKTPTKRYTSDNSISTPLYAYFNYKPIERLSIGLVFNTPFGSAMDWGDDWAGSHLIQSINLKAYNLQPTVSFKICDRLSIGAGLMMTWGKFDLSRSLMPIGADNVQNQAVINGLRMMPGLSDMPDLFAMAGNRNLMSLDIEGKAKMAVGVNVGIMWDVHEQWSLGFTYRSKLKMKVDDGTIKMGLINDQTIAGILGQLLPQLGLDPTKLTSAVVEAELPLPASLTWGVSFRPVKKWEFSIDLQYVLWSAYEKLDVKILDPDTKAPVLNLPASEKNYSNTLAFRFGGQYHAFDWMTARMGMYVDESPVRSDYLNPETPSMTKLAYTAGLTLRPTKWMSIDLAYGYVNSADPERTGSNPYTHSVLGILNQKLQAAGVPESQLTNPTTDFSGNYTARAHTFSIGLGFRF